MTAAAKVTEPEQLFLKGLDYCWDRGDGKAACGGPAKGMSLVDRVVMATCERCRNADEKAVVERIADALSLVPAKRRISLANQALGLLEKKGKMNG